KGHLSWCCHKFKLLKIAALTVAARAKTNVIKKSDDKHPTTPPDGSMQVGQFHIGKRVRGEFVYSIAKDHCSVHGEQYTDEKPDRNMAGTHATSLPEDDVERDEHYDGDHQPEIF